MKQTLLFFILFANTLGIALMAGQPVEDVMKYELPRLFKDFVSRYRDSRLLGPLFKGASLAGIKGCQLLHRISAGTRYILYRKILNIET
jgi:hypothetical protein